MNVKTLESKYYDMFPKCDSLNAILCCIFRDSYEEDKKSFEKTVTNIKTDIDGLFGLISSLDMQDKVTISKSCFFECLL